ncbi:MAG: transglutaminase family protein [Myxococcales bacterium]
MRALGRPAGAAALCGVAGLAVVGCGVHRQFEPPGPMASALLAFAAEAGSTPAEGVDAWRELDAIADRIDRRHRRTGGDWMDAFDAVVFGELGYQREIDSDDARFFRLPSMIAARRGSCLGLGALYLVLGERLGVALDGILVPGHFFVRTRGPAARNVELLRGGEAMPDDWYRNKYGPWPASAAEYMRPLSPSEVAAVGWFNLGNHARKAKDLLNAARAYARAAARFPAFAEAQASLGAVRHLAGDLDEAEAAYLKAARARDDLPGLARNLAVLKREQQPRDPTPRDPTTRDSTTRDSTTRDSTTRDSTTIERRSR